MVRDLYRVEGVAEESSQDLEIKFMSPLDSGAAVALDRLITCKPLDREQRLAWARYLLSMLYRHPDAVETIKTHMAEMWREGTNALEADFAKMQVAGGLPAKTLAEETTTRDPGAAGKSAANMIADIIGNSRAVPDIAAMPWTCVDVSQSKFSLLTSDRPLVMFSGLADPLCYLALPLSPHRLFVASHDRRYAKKLPGTGDTRIVKAMNMDVVRQAREFVWGSDDAQVEFVQRHMRTVPDRVILTEDQRQQGIAAARGL
ncbi:hypothetical protein BF49_5441 [Bradyrhizobium sp.]|nr:hypothetical protein BF49_5441 [Bradyrhizobium sp.]